MLHTGRATRISRSAVAMGGLLVAAVILLHVVRLSFDELVDLFEANPDDDLP
jgi:hypothetical protein